MLLPCVVVQAKDLPIGEIVQKATLKKVLLSEQKVGITQDHAAALAGQAATQVACAPAIDACTHTAVGAAASMHCMV
jgi:hypothetical protein